MAVEERIKNLKYHLSNPYRIKSVVETLKLGKGHCMECAQVAAMLMSDLGFKPMILSLHGYKKENKSEILGTSHAVYFYEIENQIHTIGRSSQPELENKVGNTLIEVVKKYEAGYKACGLKLCEYGTYNLNDCGFDWINQERTNEHLSFLKSLKWILLNDWSGVF